MLFKFEEYDEKCLQMTAEELQRDWERYTRKITSSATSAGVSGLFLLPSGGLTAATLLISAPAGTGAEEALTVQGLYNAHKKREIINKHLQSRNTTHRTRFRDVAPFVAIAGALAGVGIPLADHAADAVTCAAIEASVALSASVDVAAKSVVGAAEEVILHGVTGPTNMTRHNQTDSREE